jgi:Holliday junction DNA helicase RuvB
MPMSQLRRIAHNREAHERMNNWQPPVLQEPGTAAATPERELPRPVEISSKNALRPTLFEDVIGQDKVKSLLKRMVTAASARNRPLDHVLMIGPSGTGKTTLATVIANETGHRLYHIEAPISTETLLDLREVMDDGDVLFLDEIHQQAIQERRGKSASTQPEILFSLLEDFVIPTQFGLLDFPHITMIGATTDPGLLPTPFLNRFPIRPRLEPYTIDDMKQIARSNVAALLLTADDDAITLFARASRSVPREVNNFARNAASLIDDHIDLALAEEIIFDLNSLTADGLTVDMQNMLTFLLTRAKRETGQGEIRYQASVSTVATGVGLARDMKAIQLHVEPTLIERGYVQVLHGGRALTDAGVERAESLLAGGIREGR